jgi:hypothetical protein
VVLPDKEIDLGRFGPTDHVIVSEKRGPFGREWDAFKVPMEQVPRDERDKWVTKVGHDVYPPIQPPAPRGAMSIGFNCAPARDGSS